MRYAIVDGRRMNTSQILKWIKQNRDYTLCRHTMLSRMRQGLTGEDLLGPPQEAWSRAQRARRGKVATKSKSARQLAEQAQRLAKARATRAIWQQLCAWPRPAGLAELVTEIRDGKQGA